MDKRYISRIIIIVWIIQLMAGVTAYAKVASCVEDFSYGGAADGTSIVASGDTGTGFSTGWCSDSSSTALTSATTATLETSNGIRVLQLTSGKTTSAIKIFRKLDTNTINYPTLSADKTTYIQWQQKMDGATGISGAAWQRVDFYSGTSLAFMVGAFVPPSPNDSAYYPGIKWNATTPKEAYDLTAPMVAGDFYNILVMVKAKANVAEDDIISMKAWKVGQTEPISWNVSMAVKSSLTPAWIAFDGYNQSKPMFGNFKVDAYADVSSQSDTECTKINNAEASIDNCITSINSSSLTKAMVDSMSTVVGLVPTIGTSSQTIAAASLANRRRTIKAFYDANTFVWSDISNQPQDNVLRDITLPSNSSIGIAYGSNISWASSNTNALQISGNKAIVLPVKTDTHVTLTLAADIAGTSYSKAFVLTLPKTTTSLAIATNAVNAALNGSYNNIVKAVKAYNSLTNESEKLSIKDKINQIPVNTFVGAYLFKNDGYVLNQYLSNQLSCQFTVINNTTSTKTLIPIFALYNNGILKQKITYNESPIEILPKDIKTIDIDIPFSISDGDELKVFAWNNITNISPLYASGKVNSNGVFVGNNILQTAENPSAFEGVFKDECKDLSLLNARTQNFEAKKKTTPSMYYNDEYTISRLVDKPEWLEWKVLNAKRVEFVTYSSSVMQEGKKFLLYVSRDGSNWELVDASSEYLYYTGKWHRYTYSASLPDKTNYVRIVFPVGTGDVYTPQIGDVSIYYDKAELIGVPVTHTSQDKEFDRQITHLIAAGVLKNSIQYNSQSTVTAQEFVKLANRINNRSLTDSEVTSILNNYGVSSSALLTQGFAADIISTILSGEVTDQMQAYRVILGEASNHDSALEVVCKGIISTEEQGGFDLDKTLNFGECVTLLYKTINIDTLPPIMEKSIYLPTIFSDNMVLQREKDIKVWGTGTINGEPIQVELNGQTQNTIVKNGVWEVVFDPMPAVMSTTLMVKGLNTTKTLQNIGIGEVWLCSGQSQMRWRLADSDNAAAEIAAANFPDIRLFWQDAVFSSEIKQDVSNAAWTECSSSVIGDFSAVSYYFGRELQKSLNGVPIGLLVSSVGGSSIEQWMTAEQSNLPGFTFRPELPQASHYNAMVYPFANLAFRGILWYQGGSNTNSDTPFYSQLQQNFANDIRRTFNEELPLLVIQLPKYGPTTNIRAFMREQQAIAVEKITNAHLIVTIDTGEQSNVHPTEVMPVGERAGLIARGKIYHDSSVQCDTPAITSIELGADDITITFNNIYNGLEGTADGWFEIAGEDGIYQNADYQILSEGKIRIYKSGILNPQDVRYGFKVYMEGKGIHNSVGIPIAPFRTDNQAFPY